MNSALMIRKTIRRSTLKKNDFEYVDDKITSKLKGILCNEEKMDSVSND